MAKRNAIRGALKTQASLNVHTANTDSSQVEPVASTACTGLDGPACLPFPVESFAERGDDLATAFLCVGAVLLAAAAGRKRIASRAATITELPYPFVTEFLHRTQRDSFWRRKAWRTLRTAVQSSTKDAVDLRDLMDYCFQFGSGMPLESRLKIEFLCHHIPA